MKLSLKWLREYVELPKDIQELCDLYDLTGTGVEGVEELRPDFSKVVVGLIAHKEPHPDSDHMHLCKVDVGLANTNEAGEPEALQIVCGAQNFEAGDKVPVALIGAVLPGGFTIKKSKLRGQISCGMNCSKRELGMGEDIDGLWILPEDAPLGMDFAEYLDRCDTVLDLEITPNRPDCLSIRGLARETAAILSKPLNLPSFSSGATTAHGNASDYVELSIADFSRCDRYCAFVLKNVQVQPSQDWIQERLLASGIRPINNIVDATNYMMLLTGQPLHAFDYDKIVGSDGKAHVGVRAARDGEVLVTLDNQERTLTSDMTVIVADDKPIALAGVMGGANSEVDQNTSTVLLEVANFSHAHTSRTARSLGLITDASLRYERLVDVLSLKERAEEAASFMAETCKADLVEGCLDLHAELPSERKLILRVECCRKLLGIDLSADAMADILERIGCKVLECSINQLEVIVPSTRPDLEREIDLYEEILRIYGMDKVPSSLPASPHRVGVRSRAQYYTARIHEALRASGLNETMTYSFAHAHDASYQCYTAETPERVRILNPLNAEQSYLRTSIIPGLLRSCAHNKAQQVANCALYEIGNVYHAKEGKKQPNEIVRLAGVMTGCLQDEHWHKPAVALNFYDCKGLLELLFHELAISEVAFKPAETDLNSELFYPGRTALIYQGKKLLGWVAQLHPAHLKSFDIEGDLFAFELDMAGLIDAAHIARKFREIGEYPAVEMDLALIADRELPASKLEHCIVNAAGSLLGSVNLFDVYEREEHVGVGKKSLAFKLQFRSHDHTLQSKEVDKIVGKILKRLEHQLGVHLRD